MGMLTLLVLNLGTLRKYAFKNYPNLSFHLGPFSCFRKRRFCFCVFLLNLEKLFKYGFLRLWVNLGLSFDPFQLIM